jgi:hypothetical protein
MFRTGHGLPNWKLIVVLGGSWTIGSLGDIEARPGYG